MDKLLTMTEAAARLGFASTVSLYNHIKANRIAREEEAGRVGVRESECDRFLAQQTQQNQEKRRTRLARLRSEISRLEKAEAA